VFNIVNPNKLSFDKEMKFLTEKVSDLQLVPYEAWKHDVLPKLGKLFAPILSNPYILTKIDAGEDNPIYPMIKEYFGRRSWFPARDSVVDCTDTNKILQQFNDQFVEISDEVLNKWFEFVIEQASGSNNTNSVSAQN
jgi:hypothetical protein